MSGKSERKGGEKKMKQVTITPVLNGFKVQVGCQEVVFRDIDELCAELKRYQKTPAQVEKEYLVKAVNKNIGGPVGIPEAPIPVPGELRTPETGEAPGRRLAEPQMERAR
jgi:hypothetical protein